MPGTEEKHAHLRWAIESRHANQISSLRLLSLFHTYEKKWKTKKFARAAQDLSAVSFSLWRAAFLADKTGRREDVFIHGRNFLEKVIEDNSISYPQDKVSREWTFNYYTRNARSSLQVLHQYWPDQAPIYVGKKRNPTQRWEYCQKLLDSCLDGFDDLLKSQATDDMQNAAVGEARADKKRKRSIVRKMTLDARNR